MKYKYTYTNKETLESVNSNMEYRDIVWRRLHGLSTDIDTIVTGNQQVSMQDWKPSPAAPKIVQTKGEEFIAEYDSVEEAAKALGKKNGKYLEKTLAGDGTAYGFEWSYKEVEE